MKIQRNLFLLPCRPKYTIPSQFFLEQYDPRTFESQKDLNETRLESECSTRMTAWGTFLVSAVDIFVRCIDDALDGQCFRLHKSVLYLSFVP